MKKQLLSSLLCVLATISCFGWGQKGHDVTANIAEKHLTPATAHAVDSILQGKSLVYWSNWLDNASHTDQYKYTSTWHYKNIDPEYTYEKAPVNPNGNIETAINAQIATLRTYGLSLEESALALKMLTHLMGDLHQPMHMGRYSDRGGNKVTVWFFNNTANLHSVWDSSIVESGHKWSYTEWTDQIDRATPDETLGIISGSIIDWGKDTYSIATDIYTATPEGYKISYDYVAQWTPIIEEQFLRGGLRLAHVLNSIFDPDYVPEQLCE